MNDKSKSKSKSGSKDPASKPDFDPAEEVLFREVDEELREERLKALWKRFGPAVIGVAVAIVLVVAGYQGWGVWQERRVLAEAERFEAAQALAEAGALDEAVHAFSELMEDGSTGHAALAGLNAAALLVEQGRIEEALSIYDGLARRSGVDPVFRELAVVLASAHRIDGPGVGAATAALEPLAAEGKPWRHAARELLALAAYRQGDGDAAREYLRRLMEDPSTPGAMRRRAAEMLAAIGPGADPRLDETETGGES